MLILFGLVGTLFSLDKVKERSREAGIREDVVDLWLTNLQYASMASTLARKYSPFRVIAESTLAQTFALKAVDEKYGENVLAAFQELEPWEDVRACLNSLNAAGHRLAVLTNSAAEDAEHLLKKWELRSDFELVFSADDVKAGKPHPAPYRMVFSRMLVGAFDCCMVSAHEWDILGAEAVGMRRLFVGRPAAGWPFPGGSSYFTVAGLGDVPGAVARRFIAPLKAA